MTAPTRKPLGGLALLGWVVGAAAAFLLLFYVITLILRQMPDPIGPRADLFVEGARPGDTLAVHFRSIRPRGGRGRHRGCPRWRRSWI